MPQRILVVDDDPAVREYLLRSLREAGFGVTVAADGAEALRLFSAQPFDLVITDILMPDCDGLEVISHIRLVRPQVPVVAIIGADDELFGQDAAGLGARLVLVKPFTAAELHAAVRRALSPTDA